MVKKKVLILVNHEVVIYNFRKELVHKLISRGYDVKISCPPGPKLKELEAMGCEIIEQSINRRSVNPLQDVKLLFDYVKIFRKIKPDVVLTYTIKPNIYGGIVSSLLKIPYIATITGLGSSLHKESILKKIMIMLYKAGLREAKAIFVQNQNNAEFLVSNGFNQEQLFLVPGSGVNLQEFSSKPYPQPESPIRFLFIGRIMKEKGVYELLSAAKEIKTKGYDAEFHLAGFLDDGFEVSITGIPENVRFLGPIDNIQSEIESAHAIILPSYHEGMSNALLEAAASSRPLLASNISGCKEIINDLKNGFLFEPQSTNSIVDKVEEFISIPYPEKVHMGYASRTKVEKEFDRSIIVDAYLKKITEVTQ